MFERDCDRCALRAGCSQVVWGRGRPTPEVFFLGESPGDEEDLMGSPFVSRGGLLFSKLVSEAGIDPDRCYFTYAVKCASGKKGEPAAEHVDACRGWLWQELKKSSPRVVVTLGKLPTRLLLGLKKSFKLAEVAGAFHSVSYMGAAVAPWYAPNHVLQRGRAADRETVEFLKRVWEKCGHADSELARA